jgi:hypothetical protein
MALQSLEMKPHACASFISRAKNQGLKRQNFAHQAQNLIDTSRRVSHGAPRALPSCPPASNSRLPLGNYLQATSGFLTNAISHAIKKDIAS